jgi:hypothetical protein
MYLAYVDLLGFWRRVDLYLETIFLEEYSSAQKMFFRNIDIYLKVTWHYKPKFYPRDDLARLPSEGK